MGFLLMSFPEIALEFSEEDASESTSLKPKTPCCLEYVKVIAMAGTFAFCQMPVDSQRFIFRSDLAPQRRPRTLLVGQ